MNEFNHPDPGNEAWKPQDFQGNSAPIGPVPESQDEIQEPPHMDGDQPFTGEPENVGPATEEPRPDIGPGQHLGVEQFTGDGMTIHDRIAVRDLGRDLVSSIVAPNLDYTDVFTDRHGLRNSAIELQYYQEPGSTARCTLHWNENGQHSIDLRLVNEGKEDPSTYVYTPTPAGYVRQQTSYEKILDKEMPAPGTAPGAEVRAKADQRRQELAEQDAPNTALAAEMGVLYQDVGVDEMKYLQEIVNHAEPVRIPYAELANMTIRRARAQSLPDEEAGRAAADAYRHNMEKFLNARNQSDAPEVVVGEYLDPQAQAVMRVSIENTGGEGAEVQGPAVSIRKEATVTFNTGPLEASEGAKLARGTLCEDLRYRVIDGRLAADYHQVVLSESGKSLVEKKAIGIPLDKIDASSIRNFLRKPVFDVNRPDPLEI